LGFFSGGEFDFIVEESADDAFELHGLAGSVEIAVGEHEYATFPSGEVIPVDIHGETPEGYGIERIVKRDDIAVATTGGAEVTGGFVSRDASNAVFIGGCDVGGLGIFIKHLESDVGERFS